METESGGLNKKVVGLNDLNLNLLKLAADSKSQESSMSSDQKNDSPTLEKSTKYL